MLDEALSKLKTLKLNVCLILEAFVGPSKGLGLGHWERFRVLAKAQMAKSNPRKRVVGVFLARNRWVPLFIFPPELSTS